MNSSGDITMWVVPSCQAVFRRSTAAQMRAEGQAAQLDQWLAMLEGCAHDLPGYAEALAVQRTIEALLAGESHP